jgi:uncharacterized membrane protein
MKKIIGFVFAGILVISILISCSKNDNAPLPGSDIYFPKVKTIISNNCMSCHNSSGTWAGRPTKFDTDSDISSLYIAIKKAVADPVSPTNKRMPQGGSLSANDIDIIVKWFNKGGKVTD